MSAEAPQLHLRTLPESDPEGQPVVFLHGAWHAGWVWEDWMPRFAAAGYDPLAPDLRGHGESAGSWREARLADYVDDARGVIDGLSRTPILIGHSLGGLIIQHLLTHDSYPAAVLIAPIPGRYPAQAIGRFALRHPLVMARANLSRNLKALVATPKLVRETLFTEATPEETVRACHTRLTGASPTLFREMVQTRPGMPKPGTRTAVIAPDGDASFTQEMQARLADRLSAEYFEVQGSGHDVPLDATAPATVGLVLAWLRRSGQTTDPHLTTANR